MSGSFHRVFRAITRAYPYRTPSYEINRALAPILDREKPLWLSAAPYKDAPRMVLNVANRFQRKIYFFPVAYARHWLDAPLGHYMRAKLGPGAGFVDIGANIGYYTLLAASIVGPAGMVTAFEPEPGAYESLTRSIEANDYTNIRALNLALSNREGKLQLFRARDTAHSLVEATENDPQFRGAVEVKVEILDKYSEANLDERVRMFKIDVEGEEVRVLEGMLGTLTRLGKPAVWAEVRGPDGSDRAPDTFAPMLRLLAPLGYRAFRWRPDSVTEVGEADVRVQEDILFAVEP